MPPYFITFNFNCAELIGRPPIDMNSKLVDKIIVANETKRVKVYINSGCRKLNKSIQSLTNCKYLFFYWGWLLSHCIIRVFLKNWQGLSDSWVHLFIFNPFNL